MGLFRKKFHNRIKLVQILYNSSTLALPYDYSRRSCQTRLLAENILHISPAQSDSAQYLPQTHCQHVRAAFYIKEHGIDTMATTQPHNSRDTKKRKSAPPSPVITRRLHFPRPQTIRARCHTFGGTTISIEDIVQGPSMCTFGAHAPTEPAQH